MRHPSNHYPPRILPIQRPPDRPPPPWHALTPGQTDLIETACELISMATAAADTPRAACRALTHLATRLRDGLLRQRDQPWAIAALAGYAHHTNLDSTCAGHPDGPAVRDLCWRIGVPQRAMQSLAWLISCSEEDSQIRRSPVRRPMSPPLGT